MKTFTTLAIAAVFALGMGVGSAYACGPKPVKDSASAACGCDGAKDTSFKPAAADDALPSCGCGGDAADNKIAKKDSAN